jgi:hypothetical protein
MDYLRFLLEKTAVTGCETTHTLHRGDWHQQALQAWRGNAIMASGR